MDIKTVELSGIEFQVVAEWGSFKLLKSPQSNEIILFQRFGPSCWEVVYNFGITDFESVTKMLDRLGVGINGGV